MSKNKFIKKLLIGGLCVISATAMIGATACKNGGDDGEHVCKWSETYKNDATNHWKECTVAGHTGEYTKEAHKDANSDNKCDVCGYTLTTTKPDPEKPDPEKPDPEKPGETQTKDPVVVDFTEGQNGAIATGLGVVTTSSIEVKDQTRKVVYKGQETEFKKGLKMNGAAKKTEKSFKVNLPENATIIVYAASGSGSMDTYLSMLDKDGKKMEDSIQQVGFSDKVSDNYAHPAIFSVSANTDYYIGGDAAGASPVVFRIAVVYGTFTEDKGELVAAKEETCTVDGNIAHYKSEYGRYFNESGTLIGSNVAIIEKCHKYETNVTLTENLPTEENGATYTATCIRDDCTAKDGAPFEKTVNLPKLTDRSYTREAGVADAENNYTYKVTVDGINFTFEAEKHEEEKLLSLYTIIFNESKIACTSTSAYQGCTDWKVSGYKTSLNITYDGVTYKSGIKLNSSGKLTFTLNEEATVTVYLAQSGTVKVDGDVSEESTDESPVHTITLKDLAKGQHELTRGGGSELYVLRIDVAPKSAQS